MPAAVPSKYTMSPFLPNCVLMSMLNQMELKPYSHSSLRYQDIGLLRHPIFTSQLDAHN